MLFAGIISPKHGNMLNTHSNDFICMYIERVMSRKSTKPLMNINSDWMYNPSSGLCIN